MAKGRARHHAGRAARYIKGGIVNRAKANLVPGAAGAAGELGVEFAAEHLEFVNTKFWGGPALKMAAAAFLKDSRYAHALAGAAGAELAFNYKLKQYQEGKGPSPIRQFQDVSQPSTAIPSGTHGREDPSEAGMLFGSN
jgi:hypothetical protein